jgi:hypothetical protein
MSSNEMIDGMSQAMSANQYDPRQMMRTLFNRQQGAARRLQMVAWLTRRSNHLKDLCCQAIKNGRYLGTRTVEISKIKGSESKSGDFDVNFQPLTSRTVSRWVNVAVARKKGVYLPPVELIKIGDEYYVRDGHHRLSVAHAFGESFIEAIVYEW